MFLSDAMQKELRRIKKINENEVLKKEGDLYVAINVIDQQRRIVDIGNGFLERLNANLSRQNKKILKG